MPMTIESDKLVSINVEMTETQAYALAQFTKRIGWREFRDNAIDEDDAYNMRAALGRVRTSLADIGFAPR